MNNKQQITNNKYQITYRLMYARHAAKTGKILLKMLKMFLVSGYIHFENRIL